MSLSCLTFHTWWRKCGGVCVEKPTDVTSIDYGKVRTIAMPFYLGERATTTLLRS